MNKKKQKKTKKKGNCNALFNLCHPHDVVNRKQYYGKKSEK